MTEKNDVQAQLEEMYNYEVPGYIKKAGKTFIVINLGADWEGFKPRKIRIADVVRYYKEEACNIASGCRTLAGHVGDWRPIDNLAEECLEYFKLVNIEALKRISKQWGLTPKF